jgi:hypothetical protein
VIADILDAAGPLVEHVSDADAPALVAVHVAAPAGHELRFAGIVTVFRDHVSLQLDGLSREEACDVLRLLGEKRERAAVEADRPTFDHEREPGRNVVRRLTSDEEDVRIAEGLARMLDRSEQLMMAEGRKGRAS